MRCCRAVHARYFQRRIPGSLDCPRESRRRHHWPFGNMPPVKGIEANEVDQVVAQVHELQHAKGIRELGKVSWYVNSYFCS